MLKIRNRMGIPESKNSGMDTLEECHDKDHYLSYTKDISYRYNSKGFRDHEWPEDLSDVVWCVGDSFTVGVGQPFEETWPQLLGKKLGKTCLNIGEDGCANDTMALRIQEICKLHSPKLVVVMWSYFARRRVNGENVHHDRNHFGVDKDMANFSKNFKIVNELPTKIINLLIPFAFDDVKSVKEKYKNTIFTRNIDYARDHHHFDFKTSRGVSQLIIKKIIEFDNTSKYVL
jgi:hypothetical protein|tara:strand:+ start:1047 stop:1739 length:693 start_codon:yes stop_codon:yes gene_type:complete